MTTFSDEEIVWIDGGLDRSPDSYFETFDISDKQRGHIRYLRLVQSSDVDDDIKKKLLSEFEIWKRDKAPQFWLRRRARIAAIDTATALVEGSVPYAEGAILQNAAASAAGLDNTAALLLSDHTSSSVPEGSNATCAGSRSATLPSPSKKKKVVYTTEDPWHDLTVCLTKLVNGDKRVAFPAPLPSMSPTHAQLFNHAVKSLQEYQDQSTQNKDITLLKDAQVSMSCVLNTMSKRVCDHFEQSSDEDLIGEAISLSIIDDFEEHPSILYMQKYVETLAENGVHQLRKMLIIDWGLLHSKHKEHRLTGEAEVEDKVLQILIHLCSFVIHPPFHTIAPSEADCLQLWATIFGILADNVSIHTGEKMLEASKIMRKWQTEEYGDVSEAGRKVDCLFMFDGIELSNLEIKHPDISKNELGIQNKKNIRLARCIQEAHVALGVKDACVIMADVCGFVGAFYQLQPMGDISVAGRTTSTLVHLPRTAGALEEFLESSSLAIIWNFITHLERQGPRIVRAKERYNAALEKVKLSDGLAMPRDSAPPPKTRKFKHSVTLTPSKKRNLMTSGFFSGHPK